MTPCHYAVVAAVRSAVVASPEAALAEQAAAFLVRSVPQKTREQIVEELLAGLCEEKRQRELQGLNHWHQHVPIALKDLVKKMRIEAENPLPQEDFYKANYGKAMVMALAKLKNRGDAEDVVFQTYVELLEGKTSQKYFFRALKCNIIDFKRRRKFEQGVIERTKRIFNPDRPLAEDQPLEAEADDGMTDLPSHSPEDQDPLDILIRQEELSQAKSIAQADQDYRWVRRKKWARQLGIGAKA